MIAGKWQTSRGSFQFDVSVEAATFYGSITVCAVRVGSKVCAGGCQTAVGASPRVLVSLDAYQTYFVVPNHLRRRRGRPAKAHARIQGRVALLTEELMAGDVGLLMQPSYRTGFTI